MKKKKVKNAFPHDGIAEKIIMMFNSSIYTRL